MAVYQGARPRTHRAAAADRGSPRRRRRLAAPAGPRRGPCAPDGQRAVPGLVLGVIVVAFMLAFFSLAQQVRVSATSYDIGRLQVERERLDARLQELDSDLSRLGREPAVRKLALDAGLGQLGEPVVLPAR